MSPLFNQMKSIKQCTSNYLISLSTGAVFATSIWRSQNQCWVQQSKRPRTFAYWTTALTSFSIVQSANDRRRSLCWTQHSSKWAIGGGNPEAKWQKQTMLSTLKNYVRENYFIVILISYKANGTCTRIENYSSCCCTITCQFDVSVQVWIIMK